MLLVRKSHTLQFLLWLEYLYSCNGRYDGGSCPIRDSS